MKILLVLAKLGAVHCFIAVHCWEPYFMLICVPYLYTNKHEAKCSLLNSRVTCCYFVHYINYKYLFLNWKFEAGIVYD